MIVGLVGKIASGKGVVADYLVREHGAKVFRFSDVLRDILLRLNKQNTRENLQALGVNLRKAFGDDVLAGVLRDEILKETAGVVVVDGIRYWNEVEMVQTFKGSLIVAITAPVDVRYRRAASRATRGEELVSLEQFKRNEENPTERLIDEIAGAADIKIENLGSKEELLQTLDTVLKNRIPSR